MYRRYIYNERGRRGDGCTTVMCITSGRGEGKTSICFIFHVMNITLFLTLVIVGELNISDTTTSLRL